MQLALQKANGMLPPSEGHTRLNLVCVIFFFTLWGTSALPPLQPVFALQQATLASYS